MWSTREAIPIIKERDELALQLRAIDEIWNLSTDLSSSCPGWLFLSDQR